MTPLLTDLRHEFSRQKEIAERAVEGLPDAAFFERPGPAVNPIALIVKHMGGNLASRWSEFLTSDGEKPTRNRDGEFELGPTDTRAAIMAQWQRGWSILFHTLDSLTEQDLTRTVLIRNEPHSVPQAILRGLTHAAYHVGQIVYLARWIEPERPWLTIAPRTSRDHQGSYRPPAAPG